MRFKYLQYNPKPHNMRGFFRVRKYAFKGLNDILRNTAAGVRYLEADAAFFRIGSHCNGTSGRVVADAVLDQVAESPF